MPDRSVPRICLGLLALAAFPVQAAVPATSAAPAFCVSPSGAAERSICADAALRTADREVARTYAAALDKASRRERHLLRKEQQGWWAGVNDCAKTDDVHACVTSAYDTRKVELQATSHLVAARGPFVFSCDDGSRLHVTYHATEPASMVALRGDERALLLAQRSASGARYAGRAAAFWEHQGSAAVTWGTTELQCKAP